MTSSLAVFYDRDLPGMATHCEQHLCGYSIYKGVLVQWDEDHDSRVLSLVDQIPSAMRENLLVVQEHEGSVAMLWARRVPEDYREGSELHIEDDVWYVTLSSTPSPDGRTSKDLKVKSGEGEIPF